MNTTRTITITKEDAIKYYKRGGALREIAIQAFPNIKEMIEWDKIVRAKNEETEKQAKINNLVKKFPIGTLFACEGRRNFYKVTGEPRFISKTRAAINVITQSYNNNQAFLQFALLIEFSRFDASSSITNNTKWAIVGVRGGKIDTSFCDWRHFGATQIRCLNEVEAEELISLRYNAQITSNNAKIVALKTEIEQIKKDKDIEIKTLYNLIEAK